MSYGPIRRTTLWVRDAARSLAFYRDLLELPVMDDKVIEGPPIARMIGLETCRVRMITLAPPGATHGWLALYEVSAATPALPSVHAPRAITLGTASLVIEIADVAATSRRLAEAGIAFLTPPTTYRKLEPSPGMPAGTYAEAICFDPDQFSVSLMSYRPEGGRA